MRANKPLLHGDTTASIIDSFFAVHKELGFGFREYIYSRALQRLLVAKGHKVEREVRVLVYFRGEPLAYERMDMLVDDTVVIENKAREPLDSDAQGQLFAALAATNLEVGLLLHFGKRARFYRVFFENRFKHRNKRCP
jgi:GxxExxY protein